MPTIRDVAKLAGCSVATVSIVLNGKARERKVADLTARKVQAAIETLGYKPNMTARRLKSAGSAKPAIALYWPLDYRTVFLASILKGIQVGIDRMNFDCEIVVATYRNDRIAEDFNEHTKYRFSGAIIGATSSGDMRYLEGFEPMIPTVLFNRSLAGYSSVANNHEMSGEKAAALLAAKGHRRLAVITVENPHLAMSARTIGMLDACRRYGIGIEERHLLKGENSYAGGAMAAGRLIAAPDRPRALFCDSEFLALGAAHAFNRAGIAIPRDMEIIAVGMADPETTEFSTPPITIVAMQTEDMAAEAIGLIARMSDGTLRHPVSKLFEPRLLIRESCRL